MVIEFFSGLLISSLLFFCFAIRALQRSPNRARSRSESVCQPNQSEDAVSAEVFVEPLSAKQPDENAQRQLKADSSVAANTFPVLLH
jgi:hypothetical protein